MQLQAFSAADIASVTRARQGETKLGQKFATLSSIPTDYDQLATLLKAFDQVKFVVLGVPEDIGPRANFGRHNNNVVNVLIVFAEVEQHQPGNLL